MRVLAALVLGSLAIIARAEYSPDMEPGRLAVRHASWAAADGCSARWLPDGPSSVVMHITLSRRGRVLSVSTEPAAPRFARCVRTALRQSRFSVTGPDAAGPRWEVVSRFVFPEASR